MGRNSAPLSLCPPPPPSPASEPRETEKLKNNISISLWLQRYKTYKSPPFSSLIPCTCYTLAHMLTDGQGQSALQQQRELGGRGIGGCHGVSPQLLESLLLAQILHRPRLVLICTSAPQE